MVDGKVLGFEAEEGPQASPENLGGGEERREVELFWGGGGGGGMSYSLCARKVEEKQAVRMSCCKLGVERWGGEDRSALSQRRRTCVSL